MEALRPVLEKCGQEHLAEGFDALAPEQQAELLAQLQVSKQRERGGMAVLPLLYGLDQRLSSPRPQKAAA